MTQPLVTSSDADLASWQSPSQDFFLSVASAEVRKFCGWHISPSLTVTNQRCWLGGDNLVWLSSGYVTAVSSVTVDGVAQVADTDYFWDSPKNWIKRAPMHGWSQNKFALVSFTHGYASVPVDVKAVLFELAATAMELPASNAQHVQTAQYTYELNDSIGLTLNETQRRRLGPYKIPSFGGVPRG